nr:hypothetical protein [Tanacetum cinerariifolium]
MSKTLVPDPNFKIIEKRVECVRALNVALLEVVFAGPVVKVSSVIDDVFDISESNKESMEVHSKFEVGEDDDSGNAATDGGDDTVTSGDISILNSLIGHGSPYSL